LMSRKGKSIRFKETDVRPTGRNSMGVIGMDVDGSELVGMDVIEENQYILVVTEKGFGKRTIASEYRVQKRGGKGLINIRITERNGPVVGFRRVRDDDDVMLITDTGRIIRINVADVNPKGRVVQGVKLIDLGPDEKVVDIASVQEESDID
ncbi:MAG: DNA gyrase subunit A, partial [Deltaproteobacteria bacterium]